MVTMGPWGRRAHAETWVCQGSQAQQASLGCLGLMGRQGKTDHLAAMVLMGHLVLLGSLAPQAFLDLQVSSIIYSGCFIQFNRSSALSYTFFSEQYSLALSAVSVSANIFCG